MLFYAQSLHEDIQNNFVVAIANNNNLDIEGLFTLSNKVVIRSVEVKHNT